MSSIVVQTLPDAQPEAKKLKLGSFVHGFLTGWRVIHVQQAKNVPRFLQGLFMTYDMKSWVLISRDC